MLSLILGFIKGFSPTTWLIIVMGVLMAVSVVYFKYSQNTIKNLQSQVVLLKVSLETEKKHVKQLESDIILIQKITQDLTSVERKNSKIENDLARKLLKLESVAKAKPQLVENLINNASKERNRCLELSTGSKPVKNEKNSVCPQLLLTK